MRSREGFVKVDELEEVRTGAINRKTVYTMIHEGRIPHIRITSRKYLVPIDWAERLLENSPEGRV